MIYHMLPEDDWRNADPAAGYRAASLESEGFIHCSASPEDVLWVANALYAGRPGDWLILVIDADAVKPEIRWEPADGHLFPHIYGALNLDAVSEVLPFPRSPDRRFVAPERWGQELS